MSRSRACASPPICLVQAALVLFAVFTTGFMGEAWAQPPTGTSTDPATDMQPSKLEDPATILDPATTAPSASSMPTASSTDPLAPIDAALNRLHAAGFTVRERTTITNIQGTARTAVLYGPDATLLFYELEQATLAGFVIALAPVRTHTMAMVARPANPAQGPGIILTGVDRISIDGRFRNRDSAASLSRIVELAPGTLDPGFTAMSLQNLGYRSEFIATSPGEIIVQVVPGRTIRRVRMHGRAPISRREVERVLGGLARPGTLAPGQCVEPKTLRKHPRIPVCKSDDLACKAWERDEVDRLERFLFDNGYLKGRAWLGLECGRASDEVDLHVFMAKGKPYRVARKGIIVRGNVPTADHGFVKRVFMPRVKPFLWRKRVTHRHIEDAKERVEREYAEPRSGLLGVGTRRQLELPYPSVRIETSYDQLTRENAPDAPPLRLDVAIALGNGVRTAFLGNSVSDRVLLGNIQAFKRRERPSNITAEREAMNIRDYYQSRGWSLARVDGSFQDFGSLQQLTFRIQEGPRARIRALVLQRPRGVPESMLDEIDRVWRDERELARSGSFSEAATLHDLGVIANAYIERGYACATVRAVVGFWKDADTQPGQHAVLDPAELQQRGNVPRWAETQLDPRGLAAIYARKRVGMYVQLLVDPGPRLITSGRERLHYLDQPIAADRSVEDLPERNAGAWGARRMLRDGPLRRPRDERAGGIPLTPSLDRDTQEATVRLYRHSGYPVADAEIRWNYRDPRGRSHSLAQAQRFRNESVGLCRDHATKQHVAVDTDLYVYEGRRGKFGEVLLRNNFKTRTYLLKRELEFIEGEPYDESKLDVTREHIDGTGVTESVRISPQEVGCDFDEPSSKSCRVHEIVTIQEGKDRALDLGWGFGSATLDPAYVFVRPVFPNIFGTGWELELDGHYGLAALFQNRETFVRDASGVDGTGFRCYRPCYEHSARGSFYHRRIFGSPLTFAITGQFQRRVTPARGIVDTAQGSVRLTWPLSRKFEIYLDYLIQLANISKDLVRPSYGSETIPPNRREAIVQDRTGAFEAGLAFHTVDNALAPKKGIMATLDTRMASPYFGGRDWWFQTEASFRHFIPLPGAQKRFTFSYSLRYGHSVPLPNLSGAHTTSIPEVWRFFGGGTVDFGLRGIVPQTMLSDIEAISLGSDMVRLRPIALGGHIRALATFAIEMVSVRDLLGGPLSHSLFLDLGVLTHRWSQVHPARDIRRSIGINFIVWEIRVIKLALGYAVLIPDAIIPGGNVRPTDDRNGRFVFSVGVTF